jgi:hypothetical protein
MPIHEFKCPNGHVTEKLFLTFREAEGVTLIPCPKCIDIIRPCEWGYNAVRVDFSVPYPAHLLGNPDGYYKPSPQKRHSTKLINRETGNRGNQRKH